MSQTLLNRIQAPGPKKILACDGGGILGLMCVEILAQLECELRVALDKDNKFVLADYFDFVCGASTGAIIAACIASGMSMAKIRQLFLDSGRQMFDKETVLRRLNDSGYDEPFARLLRKAFDDQLLESNPTLGSPKLRSLLMMVLCNHGTGSPWLVSNNPWAKYNDLSRRDCNLFLPLWQLARASSAAPVFFSPEVVTFAAGTPEEYQFNFADGGTTIYNNPAYLAFQIATAAPYEINWQTGEDKLLIVSVGSGSIANRVSEHPNAEDSNSVHLADNLPIALMNAASVGWDMVCRTLGACRHGGILDGEVGDMLQTTGQPNFTGPKLFTYLRYDPALTRKDLNALGLREIDPVRLQTLDSADCMDDSQRVGIEYAKTQIKPEHFKGFV